jgi:hypothetical protein
MIPALLRWPLLLAALTLLGTFSALSIQKDSVLMVFLGKPSSLLVARDKYLECAARAGVRDGDRIAFLQRDGVLGFIPNDFLFLKGHPYGLKSEERADWVYTLKPVEGYAPWPPTAPCLLKRKD